MGVNTQTTEAGFHWFLFRFNINDEDQPKSGNYRLNENVRSYVRCYVRSMLPLMLGLLAPILPLSYSK